MKKIKRNYLIKILKNGEKVSVVRTHSLRKFTTHLSTINLQESGLKAFLRISYGTRKDHTGKYSTFYNEGIYHNREDLMFAFDAFAEKSETKS